MGWPYFMCCLSWSLVEVPRYLFYALKLYNVCPWALEWLRYSLFIMLYPSGILSEVLSVLSMRSMVSNQILAILMPNRLNFEMSYKFAITLALAIYPPFAPVLYQHMLSQRRKVFAKHNKKKES